MSWSFVAHRGSANNKVSGTTLSVSPGATITVGQVLFVRTTADNIATASQYSEEHSISDSVGGNTYTRIQGHTVSSGAAADGVTGELFMCLVATQITGSDSITLTVTSAVVAKAIGLEVFSIAAGATVALETVDSRSDTAQSTPSLTLSGVSGAERLWIGMVAAEGPDGDTYTQDADYANNTSFGTTGGADTDNVYSRFGSRVASLTSDTYGVTLGSARDVITLLAAIQEVLPGGLVALEGFPRGLDRGLDRGMR